MTTRWFPNDLLVIGIRLRVLQGHVTTGANPCRHHPVGDFSEGAGSFWPHGRIRVTSS